MDHDIVMDPPMMENAGIIPPPQFKEEPQENWQVIIFCDLFS